MREGIESRKGTGGSRAAGGFSYQDRVTAWFAVRLLAGDRASGVPGLYEGQILDLVCETRDEVDDCRIGLRDDILLLQAKHSVQLKRAEDSDLGRTAAAFVRQHLTPGRAADKLVLWSLPRSPPRALRRISGVRWTGSAALTRSPPWSLAGIAARR